MRISDWSSDVCSSDLQGLAGAIRQTFPSAAIVLPYGSFRSGEGAYRWTEQPDPDPEKQALQIAGAVPAFVRLARQLQQRSEEHTSELQSLMRISYAVFCLKKKNNTEHAKKRQHS